MVLYLILCVVSVLVGCGILTLIGVAVDRDSTLFLAPVVTLCSVAIFIGGFVAGGFSVGKITPALYTLCSGIAVLGAIRHGKTVLASWRSLLIIAGLPLLILLPCIVQGIENYSGGLCMDGWAYVTVGQSLQKYPLGADGWLPLDVQYAAQFGKATRFITFAFLAFLAPLSGEHNDAQEVLGHYVGWLFFLYASACMFFARAVRLNRTMAWIFVLLAMLSGWTLKLINANSVDNTLALCFLPAALGILLFIPGPSRRHGILLGAIVAALLYAYPESSPFIIAAILMMAMQRMIAAPDQLRKFARMGLALLATLVVCISPYVSGIAMFIQQEFNATTRIVGDRPGEPYYHSLSIPKYILPGYWGLTPDFPGTISLPNPDTYLIGYKLYAATLASVLTVVALFGMFLLLRRREWSLPLFAFSMTAAYTICLVYLHYPYAAYKVLVLTWFVISYIVVVAAGWAWETLGRRPSTFTRYAGVAAGLGLLTALGSAFFLQERIFYDSLPFKSLREFKKVSVVENFAHGEPVAMIVDEPYANLWATHFLRETKPYLAGQYRGYMVLAKTFLDRSELLIPSNIRFVVTDNARSFDDSRLLSRAGPYYIWNCGRGPWVILMEVNNPDGMEAGPSFWVSNSYTELRILSNSATAVTMSAEFTIGLNTTADTPQRVRVKTGNFEEERVIGNGKHSFTIPLQPGLNRILLRSLEKRPLLIRATRLSVSTPIAGETAQIRELENPNGLESWNGTEPFFWMGGGDTTMTVSASATGIAQLTAIFSPGPSLVNSSQARIQIVAPSGAKMQQDLNWGVAKIDVPVQAGLNRIAMRAIGTTVTAHGISHIMTAGVRNLQVSYSKETPKE